MKRSWWRLAALVGAAAALVLTGGVAYAKRGAAPHKRVRHHRSHHANHAGAQPVLRQVAAVRYPAPLKTPVGFDISWVDPATQTYYLSDLNNAGIDAINASTNKFESVIGAGDFVGLSATSAQKSVCGMYGANGPDGVLSLKVGGVRQLWAGDGVNAASPESTVKVFTLKTPSSGTLAASISTHGVCRADELSYDPADQLILIANDVDSPAFVSLISVHANPAEDTVVKRISFPHAIDGIEQSQYDPRTRRFYVNIPQISTRSGTWRGGVAVINPHTMKVERTFSVNGCSPAGLAIDVASRQMLLGCSEDAVGGDSVGGVTYRPSVAKSVIMSVRSGRIVAQFRQVGGSDEVWFDPADHTYYLGASGMTSNGRLGGYPAPVLGVIGASKHGHGAPSWLGNFPTAASAHSVAVNPINGHIFVPIPGYGVAVFARAGR